MLKNKKIVIFSIIICLIATLFFLRGAILRWYVAGKVEKIEERYSLVINYEKLELKGLSGVNVGKLTVTPVGQPVLFSAGEIDLKLNPFRLLLFKPDTRRLDAKDILFNFVKKDSISNYDFLYKDNKSSDTTAVQQVKLNYSRYVDNMMSLLFGVLPKNADIKNLDIVYKSGDYNLKISMPDFKVAKNAFNTKIYSVENGIPENLIFNGLLDGKKRRMSARIYGGGDSSKFTVPFINYRWAATLQFDTLAFELAGSERENGLLSISGKASAKGLSLFHEDISPENVVLDQGLVKYKVNIGENYMELDSASTVTVNQLTFSPYLKMEKAAKWIMTASLNKSDFPAQQLFSSLPKGLFYNLDGIQVSGDLNYHFYLNIDFSNVDSLKIESVLKPKNFKIVKYGNADLRRMNGEFEYTAYERGVPVRSFLVGPSNPNFRSLDQISQILQMAVMQSEDGGFFYHNGFLPESIRGALVTDIKSKRFRRGGSTISMQLVKNVFLSRHKTLARKFEEMLITWMIERNRLSSKERMFEVYLNIIEWGPMVYGANEASRYYFNKDVKDLTINESIFLAGIIPSPKRSLSLFTPDGVLIPEKMDGYYRLLAGRLKIKGLITEDEEAAVKPEIRLTGEAAKALQKGAEETVEPEEEEIF